jgi:ferrous iron transport protein A
MASKKLNELKSGEEGIIVSYGDKGDTELKRHLLGMGFVKGSKIKLKKTAPLGDPLEFQIKGYSVCLRKKEAENILIE